jgi:hypothetical protein
MEKPITYGLYDLQDKCWMSQKTDAPNSYTDPELARAAATVCCRMFKFRPGRILARPLPNKKFTIRDTVDAKMTCQEAIAELEKEAK